MSCVDNSVLVSEEKGTASSSDENSEFDLGTDDFLDEEAVTCARSTLIYCGLDLEEEL